MKTLLISLLLGLAAGIIDIIPMLVRGALPQICITLSILAAALGVLSDRIL